MIGFDSNVLLYAVSRGDEGKNHTAARLLQQAIGSQEAIIPLQAIGEFIHVSGRKFGWGPADAQPYVQSWRQAAWTDGYTAADLDSAIMARRDHRLPIWDALIWAVCDRAGASILATEDFQDGRTLGRVTFLDPFNPANAARLGLA